MRGKAGPHKARLNPDEAAELTKYLNSFRHYPILSKREDFNACYAQFEPWHTRAQAAEKRLEALEREIETSEHADRDMLHARRRQLKRRLEFYNRGRSHYAEPLICGNIRFAATIAVGYTGQGVSVTELLQESYFSLRRALYKFEPEKGFKFSTYAGWWIRQGIRRYLQEFGRGRAVRVPQNQHQLLANISRAITRFYQRHGHQPSNKELVELFEPADEKERKKLLYQISRTRPELSMGKGVSMQTPVREEGALVLEDIFSADTLNPEAYYMAHEQRAEHRRKLDEWLEKASEYSERDFMILVHRFGLNGAKPMTLQELGKEFKISRERVRQLERHLLQIFGTTKEGMYWRLRSLQDLDDILASV